MFISESKVATKHSRKTASAGTDLLGSISWGCACHTAIRMLLKPIEAPVRVVESKGLWLALRM